MLASRGPGETAGSIYIEFRRGWMAWFHIQGLDELYPTGMGEGHSFSRVL